MDAATALDTLATYEWIADHWYDLRARLRPGSNADRTGVRSPSARSKPPIDLHVSDLLFEIETEARQLAHVLTDETDWTPRTSHMPDLLRDVLTRHGHFTARDQRAALAFADWGEWMRGRITTTLEKPPSPAYVGPCHHDDCRGDVYVRHGSGVATCETCSTPYDLPTRMAWVQRQFEIQLMTLSEIKSALTILGHEIPMGTLKTWVHRGRLVPVGEKFYRISDALQLAEERHSRTG